MKVESIKEMNLTTDDREALMIALRSPGWATSLDLIGDGTDTIKWLRDCELPGKVSPPSKWVTEAIKIAVTHAISKGIFGPGEALINLCNEIGLKRVERRV